jgi:high-affinity iron transporter
MCRVVIVLVALVGWAGTAPASDMEKAKAAYAARCAFCHGNSGKGDGMAGAALKPPPTNFASADYWKATNSEQIKNAIKNGKPGTAMVPFNAALSSDEIDGLVEYLRTLAPK